MASSESKQIKAYILLVDDTPENLFLLEHALHAQGYRTRKAGDGEQALRVVEAEPPDLILMDINMPVMDGYTTCEKLKANPKTSAIPVIFASALELEADKVRAFKAGGVDYVTKPYQFNEISARLEIHLALRRLQSQLEDANRELARQLQELQTARSAERDQRLLAEALTQTIAAINHSLDYDEVLDTILSHLERIMPQAASNIALLDDLGQVRIIRARGYEAYGGQGMVLNFQLDLQALPNWESALHSRQPVVVSNTENNPQWTSVSEFNWVKSHICAPIVAKNHPIGLINLDSAQPDFFQAEQGQYLQFFADEAALAIEKARLFEQVQHLAMTDGLTGVFNRRHILELAHQEYERVQRYGHPLSFLMIDLDHFKQINDTYGHPVGDQALIRVAHCCQESLRSIDYFGRYGGEEFLVLLPDTNLAQAMTGAERLRQRVEDMLITTERGNLQVTVSIGVATLKPPLYTSLNTLLTQADDALYVAKRLGRNRVASASETNPSGEALIAG